MSFLSIVLLALLAFALYKLQARKNEIDAKNRVNEDLMGKLQATNTKLETIISERNTIEAERDGLFDKYGAVIDVDAEKEKIQKSIAKLKAQQKELESNIDRSQSTFTDLSKQIESLEESLNLLDVGVYKPKYDLETSDDYRKKLDAIYDKIANAVKIKNAVYMPGGFTMNGSLAEGKKMMNNIVKLMLRAFNGECDSCIAKVKWDNVSRMEERIRNSYDVINKASTSYSSYIQESYLKLRLEELYLTHELELKKNEEKEEQRRIKEQMREEERARREIEKAQEDAEKEEARYQAALEKARADLEKANDAKKDALQAKVAELEARLSSAHEMKERAISRAQMTKSGHVYIISNIGSFGDNVVKIGMTRRLEPLDRIKELGDASVPFEFDVHGMIYSDNAPELENRLHKAFAEKRVNLVNLRKEFFNLSVDSLGDWAEKNKVELKLTKLAEAREWRESQAIRQKGISAVEEASRKLTEMEKVAETVVDD